MRTWPTTRTRNRWLEKFASQLRWGRRQYFAIAVVLLCTDDALLFHQFDQSRCAVVADLQTTLHAGDRRAARFRHDAHGLVVPLVVIAFGNLAVFGQTRFADHTAVTQRMHIAKHAFDVFGLALVSQVRDDFMNFIVADKGAMHAL